MGSTRQFPVFVHLAIPAFKKGILTTVRKTVSEEYFRVKSNLQFEVLTVSILGSKERTIIYSCIVP